MKSTVSGRDGQAPYAGTDCPGVDSELFRTMMSGFPSGVAVVTTVDGQGAPRGLTCTSVCSVSLSPPTLLVCLDNRSGTLRDLTVSGVFAVNLLHADGRSAAEVFAAACPDRFDRVAWECGALRFLPRLTEDAHAVAECRVSQAVPVGDHTIVVGAVEEVTRMVGNDPLIYGQRRYGTWSPTQNPAGLQEGCA